MGIKAAQQQLQTGQLQQQGLQQENQLRQMQLQDQQKLRQIMTDQSIDWTKPEAADEVLTKASAAGVSPQTLIAMRNSNMDYMQKFTAMSKDQQEMHIKDLDQRRGQLTVLANDPKYNPADPQYQQQLASLGLQGTPGKDDLLTIANSMALGSTLAKESAANRQAAAAEQRAAAQQWKAIPGTNTLVNTDTGEQRTAGPGTPGMQEAQYRQILAKKAAGQALTPQELALARAYEASQSKTTSTSDSLGIMTTNTSRPTGLASLGARGPGAAGGAGAPGQPNAKDSLVDLIGQYKANPELLGRMLYRHPEVLGMLHQKYPDFDETNYVAKNKLMQSYTSGQKSGEINAINTVAGHLDELDQAVAALNNGDINALNKVANTYKIQTGASPQATFRTIVNRIGPEITKAYISGGGGEGERFANAQDFSPNLAPQQLHGNIAETVKLLRSKIGTLDTQYQNTVHRDDFQQRFITPAAQGAFSRLAPQQSAGGKGPAVGAIEQGYRFKGGDPSKPESWEKVQ